MESRTLAHSIGTPTRVCGPSQHVGVPRRSPPARDNGRRGRRPPRGGDDAREVLEETGRRPGPTKPLIYAEPTNGITDRAA